MARDRRLRYGRTPNSLWYHKDAAKLDGRYAAFGEMLSGFSVLDKIADEPTYWSGNLE